VQKHSNKIVFFFFLFIMISFSSITLAAVDYNQIIVEDSSNYLDSGQKESLEGLIKKLPEIYRVVILNSTVPDVENASKTIFEYRKLSEDTILILVLTNDKQIFMYTGEALQKKGLNQEFFKQEINNYFVPYAQNGFVYDGLVQLVQEISKDLPKFLVAEKNSPKLPDQPKEMLATVIEEAPSEKSPIIYNIAGVIAIIIIGFVLSKGILTKRSIDKK